MLVRDLSSSKVMELRPRDVVDGILNYIGPYRDFLTDGAILILYGLRRTGKTTAMEQAALSFGERYLFLEAEEGDTMADVTKALSGAYKDGIRLVFIDEITRVENFAENPVALPDIFAKMGMRIVVTGTDSLSFGLAHRGLYGRGIWLHTTHIPYAEHAQVLGITDIDDYIRYGGLMAEGKNKRHITNPTEAARYLDEAVAENIVQSLQKRGEYEELSWLTKAEILAIIEKAVEKYDDVILRDIITDELKNVSVNAPVGVLNPAVRPETDVDVFLPVINSEKEIIKEFAKEIRASGKLSVTDEELKKIMEELTTVLTELEVLSRIPHDVLRKGTDGWRTGKEPAEWCIVQPAVKYFHLQKGQEFYNDSEYFQKFSTEEKELLYDRLEKEVMGHMLEQIVAFDVQSYLADIKRTKPEWKERYHVCKLFFKEKTQNLGEYDLLVRDDEEKCHWAFEVKHTETASQAQAKHLENPEFTKTAEYFYGPRAGAYVLYRGETNGMYLNVEDFLVAVHKHRDIRRAVSELEEGRTADTDRRKDKT